MEDISFDLAVQLDVDKYVNFLLKQISTTEEEKRSRIKTMVAVRCSTATKKELPARKKEAVAWAANEIYVNTTYWKQPSAEDIKNFPTWRKNAFDQNISFFETYINSPLPQSVIIDKECDRISNKRILKDPELLPALLNGWLTEKYFEMAELSGCIDYLKWLYRKTVFQNAPAGSEYFDDYLAPDGVKIAGELIALYTGRMAKELILMVKALRFLDLAKPGIDANQARLRRMLNSRFKVTFTETAYKAQLDNFRDPGRNQKDEIKFHVDKIETLLLNMRSKGCATK